MSERIYGWLLALYPKSFRERFGGEMVLLLRDRLREETGAAAGCRLWLELAGDVLRSAPWERARAWRRWRPAATFLAVVAATAIGIAVGLAGHALLAPLLALQSMSVLFMLVRLVVRSRHRMPGQMQFRVDDGQIERVTPGAEPQIVLRTEVSQIMEIPGVGLVVAARNLRGLFIPGGAPDFAALRETLAQWGPIKIGEPPDFSRGGRLLRVSALLWLFPLYLSAMLVRTPVWSAVLGGFAAVWLLAFWSAIRSKRPGSWKPQLILASFAFPVALHAVWIVTR
jgi:hypothetical protein